MDNLAKTNTKYFSCFYLDGGKIVDVIVTPHQIEKEVLFVRQHEM